MVLEIAEHLIRLARNAVAGGTACRTEEQKRAFLFILRQRIPFAARKPVDRRIGEREGELEFGNGLPKHIKGDRRACLDLGKDFAE